MASNTISQQAMVQKDNMTFTIKTIIYHTLLAKSTDFSAISPELGFICGIDYYHLRERK